MAVVFTYGATTCTFAYDPSMGNYRIERKWMSPRTASGGGEFAVYNKALVRDIETLTWNIMTVDDVTALLAFLEAVDGSANPFDYTDVNGTTRPAYILNSDEIKSYPTQILREGMTMELFIAPDTILLDEDEFILYDELYGALMEDMTLLLNVMFDETGLALSDEVGLFLLDQTAPLGGLRDEGNEYLFDNAYSVLMEE